MQIKSLKKDEFFLIFNKYPHIFLSKGHLDLHLNHPEDCMFLCDEGFNVGVVLKREDAKTISPYSAPFGGIFSKDIRVQYNIIDSFVKDLCFYLISIEVSYLRITFPSILYSINTTTKFINSLINLDYSKSIIPEINNHIELSTNINFRYHTNTEKLIRKATKAGLKLQEVFDEQKFTVYSIIKNNREARFRNVSLSFSKLISLDDICETRYFFVKDDTDTPVAGAIIFKVTPEIMYAQYWGDNERGRKLNAMDFLSFKLVKLFMDEGYSYFDVGISTENGIPNSGLLRFKESHLFNSTLRFTIDLKLI